MSDLLSIGRSGVIAYRAALSAVGENVANAETEGYTRRTVAITESGVGASNSYQYRASAIFGGANIGGVKRVFDDYKAAYARLSQSEAGRGEAKLQWLQTSESALDDSAVGLGVKMSSVFTAAEALSADVNSDTARQTVMTALQEAADQFNTTGTRLREASDGVATAARVTVDGLNGQLKALSQVNIGLRRAAEGTAAHAQLLDQRDGLLGKISTAIGVDVRLEDDGRADVRLAGYSNVTLVDSEHAQTAFLGVLEASDGHLSLVSSGITTSISISPQSGTLSGLVDVSNTIASRRSALDAIATSFSNTINSWNSAGVDRNGDPGANLYTGGTSALTMRMTTTDLSKISAQSTDGVANGNALALRAQRTPDAAEAKWSLLVAAHSQVVASAKAEASASSTQREGALLAVDEVTGIDLDVEAAQLLRFQQAYSGSAKVIQVAREILQEVMGLFR